MTPEQFCYWLQGFAEINEAPPNDKQWANIIKHLQLVSKKATKSDGPPIKITHFPFNPPLYPGAGGWNRWQFPTTIECKGGK